MVFAISNVTVNCFERYLNSNVWWSSYYMRMINTAITNLNKIVVYIGGEEIELNRAEQQRAGNKLNKKLFLANMHCKELQLTKEEFEQYRDIYTCLIALEEMVNFYEDKKVKFTFDPYVKTLIKNFINNTRKWMNDVEKIKNFEIR